MHLLELINASLTSAFTSMSISGLYKFSNTLFASFFRHFAYGFPFYCWVSDSGASDHMTTSEQNLKNTKPYVENDESRLQMAIIYSFLASGL